MKKNKTTYTVKKRGKRIANPQIKGTQQPTESYSDMFKALGDEMGFRGRETQWVLLLKHTQDPTLKIRYDKGGEVLYIEHQDQELLLYLSDYLHQQGDTEFVDPYSLTGVIIDTIRDVCVHQ